MWERSFVVENGHGEPNRPKTFLKTSDLVNETLEFTYLSVDVFYLALRTRLHHLLGSHLISNSTFDGISRHRSKNKMADTVFVDGTRTQLRGVVFG